MEHAVGTGFSRAELEVEQAELLPARQALGGYGGYNVANIVASNTALALNAGSYASWASASANQYIFVAQGQQVGTDPAAPVGPLEDELCELLPPRAALALVNITTITAVNLALAVNAASSGSTATACATQILSGIQY